LRGSRDFSFFSYESFKAAFNANSKANAKSKDSKDKRKTVADHGKASKSK
jgi:hypothetical protein